LRKSQLCRHDVGVLNRSPRAARGALMNGNAGVDRILKGGKGG
jgi:hypothetical protein